MDVTLKLAQLQNLCKRDPEGYRDDYEAQVRRLESECGILKLNPQTPSPRMIELVQFVAAVSSSSYKGKESDMVANILITLLVGSSPDDASSFGAQQTVVHMSMPTAALQLHREIRKACVSALILMRNKGTIEPLRILQLFFRIMAVVPDKALREILYKHMVNDIRNVNKRGKKDEKVNRSIQSFLHRVVSTHGQEGDGEEAATDIAAKRATDMVCELYRRQVWTDDRTVAILASAILSKNTAVMSRAIKFFLNIEEKMEEDKKKTDEEEWDSTRKVNYHKFSKKTAARERHVERQLKNRKKQQQKREGTDEWMDIRDDQGVEASKKLFPAIELLHDPQGLAESVLRKLKTPKSISYKVKLLMMNFVTRLVGNHGLLLLSLYPFLQKYMGGNQKDVTAVLVYTVQACHEQVPPDEVYGILKTIAHNFITERCSEEQMAVGINACRSICARVPAVMSVEESKESTGSTVFDVEAFAQDLSAYSNHRDRSVSIAGKAWTNFVREAHPSLLAGKNRGLKGTALHRAQTRPMRFGERKVASGVEGADLLVEYESRKAAWLKKKRENRDGSTDKEVASASDEVEAVEAIDEESEDEAPDLVGLKLEEGIGEIMQDGNLGAEDEGDDEKEEGEDEKDEKVIDLSKMTPEERENLKQHVSSTRVFTAEDFERMRKLIEREERAKRDPREAARRKRAITRGEEFEGLSGDESESDNSISEDVRIVGVVNPKDIMAEAKRKRQSKAEKLRKIIAGREKFEAKERAGGSTNVEKLRRKNFMMQKDSFQNRDKGSKKGGLSKKRGNSSLPQMGHEAKKRRRRV